MGSKLVPVYFIFYTYIVVSFKGLKAQMQKIYQFLHLVFILVYKVLPAYADKTWSEIRYSREEVIMY